MKDERDRHTFTSAGWQARLLVKRLERKRREPKGSNASDHGEGRTEAVGETEIIGTPPPMRATGRTE
jgi:hypothetical protein